MTQEEFKARLKDARVLSNLLKSICLKDYVHVRITKDKGMMLMTETAKSLQAKAFITKGLFEDYEFVNGHEDGAEEEEEDYDFSINASHVIECLDIFGHGSSAVSSAGHNSNASGAASAKTNTAESMHSTQCRLKYERGSDSLEILLEDKQVLTNCKFAIFDDYEIRPWSFVQDNEILGKIIMDSSAFSEAMLDYQNLGSVPGNGSNNDHITFEFSVDGLILKGMDIEVLIEKDGEVVDFYNCGKECSFMYRFGLLQIALKMVGVSSKTSIRINDVGILSIQYMLRTAKGESLFIEYLVNF